ncbi:MAG: glycosyltransferase, partial [Anaerolineaceae bacterium]|nr:glycosyltransferase [Anaerolineaceae bacterium]
SLELYIEDNPVIDRFYHFLDAERKYHRKSLATIIQDGSRADALLKSNGVEKTNVLHLPVSAKGKAIRDKSGFLQKKLNIDQNKKIILYFGGLDKTRSISQIVESAKYLDDGVVLVLHGFGPKRYIKHLISIADKSKVIFSFDFVPEAEILNLISSAHIGIALYKTSNANDRLVAFSSSKIAYYTQCGVPIIAFDTESFRELANSYQCVELINTFNEIPYTVRKILGNYDFYREESFSAYQRFYNLDDNFSRLIRELEQTVNNSLPTVDAY